jgi:hypothetical protein
MQQYAVKNPGESPIKIGTERITIPNIIRKIEDKPVNDDCNQGLWTFM